MASTQLSIFDVADSERAKKTFYPTPEPLAKKLLEGLDWSFIESILEPSAGKGDLARVCAGLRKQAGYNGYYPTSDWSWSDAIAHADIDCIEIDPTLRAVLEQKNFRVIHDDFLTYETQKRYHLIAMNPPFDRGAAHLLHALDLMARGGEIRCIAEESIGEEVVVERARAQGVYDSDFARVIRAYQTEIGRDPSGSARELLVSYYEDFGADAMIVAIKETNKKQAYAGCTQKRLSFGQQSG